MEKIRRAKVDTSLVTKSQNNNARTSLAIAEIREEPKVVIYRNNAADLLIDKQNIDSLNLENYAGIVITGTALSDEPSRSTMNYLSKNQKMQNAQLYSTLITEQMLGLQYHWHPLNFEELQK